MFSVAIRHAGSLLKDFSQPLLVLYKVSFPHQYSLQARQGLLVLCNKRYQKFFTCADLFLRYGAVSLPLVLRFALHAKRLVRLTWLIKCLLCRLISCQYEFNFLSIGVCQHHSFYFACLLLHNFFLLNFIFKHLFFLIAQRSPPTTKIKWSLHKDGK